MIKALLGILLASGTPWTDFYNEPGDPAVPKIVRRFIIKVQACGHFSSEFPYDAERKAFLDKRMRQTCTGLVKRKRLLLQQYRHSTAVQRAIADAWGE